MGEMSAVSHDTAVDSASPRARAADRLRADSLALHVLIVAGVALILGLIRLRSPSLWLDESLTALRVDYSVLRLFEGYHGMYDTILKPWALVAGTSEWSLRLPSVLGSMLAAGLLVVLGRRVFAPMVGLVSGLLLASSPFIVKWSQQARGYTLLLALGILATILLLRALERGSRGAWLVYGIVFAGVLVWHPVAGILLAPSHAVLVAQRRDRILPHGLLGLVVIVAIGVPWVAQIAMRSTGEGVAMNWLGAPTFEEGARALLDVSGAAGFGLLLGLVGLVLLWRVRDRDRVAWLATWAFAPFVVALVVTIVRPIYLDRYLMLAAPAFALLGGVALTGLTPRLRIAAAAAVAVAVVAGLASWYSTTDDGNWRGEDWRTATQFVLERSNDADAVVVAPWSAAPAARYYGADAVDTSRAESIWVLTWSERGDEVTASERSALGFGEHRLVERTQFGRRVSAQLWRRPAE
jgi:mannosyltransferase